MASAYPKTKIGARANASRARGVSSPGSLGERGRTPGARLIKTYTPTNSSPATAGVGGQGASKPGKMQAIENKAKVQRAKRNMKSNLKAARPSGVTKASKNLLRASRGGSALGAGMMAFQAGRDLHNYVDRKRQKAEFQKGTKSPVKSSVAQATAKRLGI